MFTNITFANPELFLLLLFIPLYAVWYFFQYKERFAKISMSSLQAFGGRSSLRGKFRTILPLLRILAFAAFVVALARPQATLKEEEIKGEGIDIVMAMDLSSSMLAQDFKPNRLEVSKQVAADFVNKREFDRIGLIVFAGESFTQCPLTSDHEVVIELLSKMECGTLQDGTAIGMGLATGVNRLKESDSKSKVMILLTDGENNSGYVQPLTAAEIAKEFGVKVYTIGVGSEGDAIAPIGRRGDGQYVFGFAQVQIDEELLKEIASMTGGKYFRATDGTRLEAIYNEIDRLEKTEREITTIKRYSEEFYDWAMLGILLLVGEFGLRYSIFRSIP